MVETVPIIVQCLGRCLGTDSTNAKYFTATDDDLATFCFPNSAFGFERRPITSLSTSGINKSFGERQCNDCQVYIITKALAVLRRGAVRREGGGGQPTSVTPTGDIICKSLELLRYHLVDIGGHFGCQSSLKMASFSVTPPRVSCVDR